MNKSKGILDTPFKKIAFIIWLILLVIFAYFVSEEKNQRDLVKAYNSGNNSYNMEWYDIAETYYKVALQYHPEPDQICSIRINQALAMVTPLTPDYINDDNIDDVLAKLKDARDCLIKDGCAHENDNDGHSEDAQTLKNEIDDYIRQLEQQYAKQDKPSEEPNNSEPEDPEDDDQKQLREIFNNMQQQGMIERNQELLESEQYKNGYDYYDGKSW